MTAKNRHAQALRAIPSAARDAASARNGRLGGRPSVYRWSDGQLQKRHGDTWTTLVPPYDRAAKAWLARNT